MKEYLLSVFGLSMDDPEVMAGLILQAIGYLGLISMALLCLQCASSFARDVTHKIYPKIKSSEFHVMSYLKDMGPLVIYVVKAAVAVFRVAKLETLDQIHAITNETGFKLMLV